MKGLVGSVALVGRIQARKLCTSSALLSGLTPRQAKIRDQYLAKYQQEDPAMVAQWEEKKRKILESRKAKEAARAKEDPLSICASLLQKVCGFAAQGDRSLSEQECCAISDAGVSSQLGRVFHATFFRHCARNSLKQIGLSYLHYLLRKELFTNIVEVGFAIDFCCIPGLEQDLRNEQGEIILLQLAELCDRYDQLSRELALQHKLRALCLTRTRWQESFEILATLSAFEAENADCRPSFLKPVASLYETVLRAALRERNVSSCLKLLRNILDCRVSLSDESLSNLFMWCAQGSAECGEKGVGAKTSSGSFNLIDSDGSCFEFSEIDSNSIEKLMTATLRTIRETEQILSAEVADRLCSYFTGIGWHCTRMNLSPSSQLRLNPHIQPDIPCGAVDAPTKLPFSSTDFDVALENIAKGERVLVIMRGLPGSGKTTHSRRIVHRAGKGLILSADDYFTSPDSGEYHYDGALLGKAHQWNLKRAVEHMGKGDTPLIADNTNTVVSEMKGYVLAAVENGYQVHFIEPSTQWKFNADILTQRCVHGVSTATIQRMLERYDRAVTIQSFLHWINKPVKDRSRVSCPKCSTHMEPLSVSAVQVATIASVLEKHMFDRTYYHTTPKEFHGFLKFLTGIPPCDLVVDSLNVANRGVSSEFISQKELLLRVVAALELARTKYGFRNILVITKRHLLYHFKQNDPWLKLAHWFAVDNVAHDDLFVLTGALMTSPGAYLMTNDYFRDHRQWFGEHSALFAHWYRSRNIRVMRLQRFKPDVPKYDIVLQMPEQWRVCTQSSVDGDLRSVHVPYDDGSVLEKYCLPSSWLCFSKNRQKLESNHSPSSRDDVPRKK